MFIPIGPPRRQHSGVYGPLPTFWAGTGTPDGDDRDFANGSAGDVYAELNRTNKNIHFWVKRKEDTHDDDWGNLGGVHCVAETFTRAQMTDGGSTSGTFVFGETIPVGAVVLRTLIKGVTGFIGDTSATITIGDGSDVDRYNTSTPNVFVTDASVDAGAASGTVYHDSAATITATITSGSDFTLVTAGRVSIFIFYLL